MSIEEELDIIYFKILSKDEIYKYIANKHDTYHDHIIIENYPEDLSSITYQTITLRIIKIIDFIEDSTSIVQFFNEINAGTSLIKNCLAAILSKKSSA